MAAAEPPRLSEAWTVEGRHTGCYTGGKVSWCEGAQLLGCLCNEDLQLVSLSPDADESRKVSQDGDGVLTFAIDPSGKNACTSHRSGLLRHFELLPAPQAPAERRSWKAHDNVIADLCFDAAGAFVATGSVDKTAKVWDFTGYFCTHNFRGHPAMVSIVRFHPTRLQLVTVADTEVRLWDLKTSTCVGVMKDHLTSISSLCFARLAEKSYQLVTGGRDQIVNVWQLEQKPSLVKTIPVFENVEGVAAVPLKVLQNVPTEGASDQGAFSQWLQRGAKLPPFVVVTVGDKGLLRVWSPADGTRVASHASPHAAKGAFRQVHLLDGIAGRRLLTVGDDLNLVVWTLPELVPSTYIMGQNEEIVHVQFIPSLSWPEATEDAPAPAAVGTDRFVCITNDEFPRVVRSRGFGATMLRGHSDVVISCDVSADGRWIATGGKDQSIRVWSASQCRPVCVLAGHAGSVSALSFPKKRPKGPASAGSGPLWLVSGSQDKTMKIWKLPSEAQLEERLGKGDEELSISKAKVTVVAHAKEVNDVTVAPNNKLLASGGHDKIVRVWKFPEGSLMGECKGHRRGVWCVAFSPTDQVIASASGDSTVRLWNLKDYTTIRAFQGHESAVLRVCFLGNGVQLMTSSVDGLLKLWHIRTADCAATFEEHTGKVWCIDVIGDRMVSGGADAKMCVWRDTTIEKAKAANDARAEVALKDSRIGLLVRDGKLEKAMTLALDLNRPGQLKQIISEHTMDAVSKIVAKAEAPPDGEKEDAAPEVEAGDCDGADGPQGAGSVGAVSDLDLRRWIVSLSDTQLERLVGILDSWISNRKMASLAQMLMGVLLLSVPPARLKGLEGMNATCGSVLSYSSRHMTRVESLLQKTFVLELVMQSGSHGLVQEGVQRGAAAGEAQGGGAGGAEEALRRTMDVLLGGAGEGEDADTGSEEASDAGDGDDGGLLAESPPAAAGGDEDEDEDEAEQEDGEASVGGPTARKRRRLRS
ncbi:unnamed protein product [Prorocentrum cordatum]|uniref:U3 small nucleolar RNA-associated protein 13 C-terminal domain-containing protein n=1 Tax=Prorocentrum cordatum TaxID=2364126 RepID=A0ABN9RTB7_9DINO|nr:unnamed protein product [Polarella glacialis]